MPDSPTKRSRRRSTRLKREIHVTESSGNVFADLGLPDADELLLKAYLVSGIETLMKKLSLNQTAVAKRLDLPQQGLSRILKGHFELVPVARLLEFLAKLDAKVEIRITHPAIQPKDSIIHRR